MDDYPNFGGCLLFVIIYQLLDRHSDPFEVTEVPPDHECLADDVLFRHKTPIAAVAAAVAVVAHCEVVCGGYLAGKSGVIVRTIFLVWEAAYPGEQKVGDFRIDQNLVGRVHRWFR